MGSWRSPLLSSPTTSYYETGITGICSRKGRGSGKSWLELRVPVAEEGGKRGRGVGCHAPSGLSQSLLGAKESAGLE